MSNKNSNPKEIKGFWPLLSRIFSMMRRAFRYSWLSLIIIGFVYLLMTKMDQGATIYTDLLDYNWLNYTLFYYLFACLVFICSHYPVYVEKGLKDHSANGHWHMARKGRFLGVGIITYQDSPDSQVTSESLLNDGFRKSMGILLITVIVYLGSYIHFENIIKPTLSWTSTESRGPLTFLLLFALVSIPFAVVFLIKRKFKKLECENIDSINVGSKILKPKALKLTQIGRLLNVVSLNMFVVAFIISLWFVITEGWSKHTYISFQCSLFVFSFYYSSFRFFRKNSILRDDTAYVRFLSFSGFVSLIIIVLAHIYVELFNPFIIFLAQLILFYGLVIIPKKHVFYFKQSQFDNRKSGAPFYFRYVHLFVPFVLIGWLVFADIVGNDLHLVKVIPQRQVLDVTQPDSSRLVDLEKFINEADEHFDKKDKIFLISSFGGGMKANIWNMLLLDSLSHYNGNFNILSNTLAMSGVSGGALGQCMFTGFKYRYDTLSFSKRIREFGKTNLVSSDLTYVLGLDLLLEFLPSDLFSNFLQKIGDRELLAMNRHDAFVDPINRSMTKKTYQELWSELFYRERSRNSFYPALIENAAGINTKRGVAFSVYLQDTDFVRTFYNSTDLLKYNRGQRSIPFFAAASISNRFPIFSPAAKLQNKGHFIDGGYFENSGMLSMEDLYRALKRNKSRENNFGYNKIIDKPDSNFYFIQIANGRDEYLQKVIGEYELNKKVKEASELSSILSTITSISFVPSYISAKYRTENEGRYRNYIELQLPYFIHKSDIDKLLQAEVDISKMDKNTIKAIEQNNQKLLEILGNDMYKYTQPPLARMLGRQSLAYMTQVIRKGDIFKELNDKLK